ncbi:hypothetical protein CRN84_22725 [Budvicia aquatica]|uniref:DUF3142 domain-containing protein n=2 Tax=Budvicia aquatica TaxID=82979 RepID=A0A2C6DSY5_9GAMM|nr:hypothetical protein CRN84_22725 [Budvicia aquatica]
MFLATLGLVAYRQLELFWVYSLYGIHFARIELADMNRVFVILGVMAFLFGMLLGHVKDQNPQPSVNVTSWQHQAYIWQRVWTPQHREALQQSHELFSGLRILAVQLNHGEGIRKIAVDTRLLQQDGRPVWLVVRIDGQLPSIDSSLVYENLFNQLHQWQQAGLTVAGIEIDYDSASSKLAIYQQFLKQLRMKLPAEQQLSLTVLPSWIESPDLPALLQQTDTSVLQVHAVLSPQQGLFDAKLASGWIARYSQLAPKPFFVALPAYGMGLAGYQDQKPIVESETSVRVAGQMQELSVEPQAMAAFLSQLRQRHLPNLNGLIWFRLPLENDRRAWSMSTLKAVILQQPLVSEWTVEVQAQPAEAGQNNSLYNLILRNTGQIDGVLPEEIVLPEGKCQIADGVGHYQVNSGNQINSNGQRLSFVRMHSQQLRAGQSQALGWARCTSLIQGDIHVNP